ncbi:Transcription initiation factor IIE subunit alpha [Fulvia fulva]|uniref:Transcription initiation factor IIE subunit alpha n=1 Tax=Passalora fulva TaxID=5499 RepID=A0A9Q8LHL7_PASFU|nr:Transcription initiation factor IIE subunit alpha [Fulvia fulva]KAK4624556.1 Transcription initiation factor IIE subunit alpha [Fulvia fulva]KAK4625983.1 Transcription initiation factor IIE subunit alpha [Fulvia fulva]UJO17562.1 Transcription initiation factor IIE subunit alpha [Fulvia fulva]WPV14695.1 Transcription initiation factor IIE subunit alpha [Fulvia fulva]WPV30396.1 Transcription initiation factor IIE subunit alpha [Fulvia fulva]
MAELALELIRTTVRAFYPTEHVLVIDALAVLSTASDQDLASILGVQPKQLRRSCGRLKEDGLLSVQTRQEKRTDGTSGYMMQPGKERMTNRDWYYLNYHRAIDSIKYRMYRLDKHIESMGAPTTEKKDLTCLRCKSAYTYLEASDSLDAETGAFICKRCNATLEDIDQEERANENESMKRLNLQMQKLTSLMQQIDAAVVPENDFQTALSKQIKIARTDANPGARTETVDVPKGGSLQSAKGIEIQPEKIAVQVQDDEDVKREAAAKDEAAKKEREARQNALPEWISKSTITDNMTVVGAKEAAERRAREVHAGGAIKEEGGEKKPDAGKQDDVMADYWAQLAAEKEKEAQQTREEEEEDDDDEDEFEFEDTLATGNATPANGAAATSTGMNTPLNAESSNATDDERDAKRPRVDQVSNGANGAAKPAADTPAASDEDEDEMDFEDV